MSAALVGKKKPEGFRPASCRPEIAAKIRRSWTKEKREAARQRGLENAKDQAWRDLIAYSVAGELNPNYKGKGKASPYTPGFDRAHRRLIKERDGFRCTRCGSTKNLDIHHIDGSKDNHHPDNLTTVCRKCHANDPIDSRNSR